MANPLKDSSWRLVAFLTGGAETQPIPGTTLTANFGDASLSGSGGCNQFGATYITKLPSQISIRDLFSTEIFCEEPPGVTKQEQDYFARLQGATTLHLGGSGPLVLVSDKTDLGLKFERAGWVKAN